jgi:hypothetical protein
MSGNSKAQNLIRIELNEDTSSNLKSPEKLLIPNNVQNNSNIKEDLPNNLLDSNQINIFFKELQSIAKTGNTSYTWEELKPYILYYYEKNTKMFKGNENNFDGINFSDKKSNGNLGFNFLEKKSSNINYSKELDLNLSNEHFNYNEDDNDKHINNNLLDDFNFQLNNNNSMNLNLHEQNFSFAKATKNNKEDENITKDIIDYINKIRIMPFTIQRIAELLLEPEKYYSSLVKYNRAFNKLVSIDFY